MSKINEQSNKKGRFSNWFLTGLSSFYLLLLNLFVPFGADDISRPQQSSFRIEQVGKSYVDEFYEPHNEIQPNHYQQRFLQKLAAEHNYLFLGDTDHRYIETDVFCRNETLIKCFEDVGKTHFILEYHPDDQHFTRSDVPREVFMDFCQASLSSPWAANEAPRKDLCARTYQSITAASNIVFLPVDQRLEKDAEGYNVFKAEFADTDNMFDDRDTVKYILEHTDNAVIVYGSRHADSTGKAINGVDHSMKKLLLDAGKSMCIVNVFRDAVQRQEYYALNKQVEKVYGKLDQPDVEILVYPEAHNPSGIDIINSDLKPLFSAIHDNITASMQLV